jgi:hypothetical protein
MNKKFIKNCKGDIPIVVLVIGVIVICTLTIVSFSLVVFTLNNSFYGVNTMKQMNLIIEEYLFYKNLGMGNAEIGEMLGQKVSEYGNNYIYLEEKGVSLGDVDKIVFSVKYYFP